MKIRSGSLNADEVQEINSVKSHIAGPDYGAKDSAIGQKVSLLTKQTQLTNM